MSNFSASFAICLKFSGAFALESANLFLRCLCILLLRMQPSFSFEGQQLGLQLQRIYLCPHEDERKVQIQTYFSTSQERLEALLFTQNSKSSSGSRPPQKKVGGLGPCGPTVPPLMSLVI